MNKVLTVLILAAAALALLVISLIFIGLFPWLLVGLPAVLLGIAAIIHAINGSISESAKDAKPRRGRTTKHKK